MLLSPECSPECCKCKDPADKSGQLAYDNVADEAPSAATFVTVNPDLEMIALSPNHSPKRGRGMDAAALLGATLSDAIDKQSIPCRQNMNSNGKAHAMSMQDRFSSMETQVDAAELLEMVNRPIWLPFSSKDDDVSSSDSEASLSGSALDKESMSEKNVNPSASEASESSLSGSILDKAHKGSLREKKTSCPHAQTLSTMLLEEQERLEREEEQRRFLLDQQAGVRHEQERKLQEMRCPQEEARQGMLQEYQEKIRLQGLEEARQRKFKEMDDEKKIRAWMNMHGFNTVNNLSHLSKLGRKKHPEMERKSKKGERFKKVTPLHVAVVQNNLDIVKLLLAAGADSRQFNSKKQTPLKLAQTLDRKGSHAAVVQVLEMDQLVLAGLPCELDQKRAAQFM